MDSHVIRFFFYTAVALISAARLEASAEESPRVRCIHAWVNSRPEDNAATTEFFPEDRLSRFFENETLPPNLSKKGEIMNLPFYESTRNFCLYFKAADDESEKPMRSNDVHSAFLDLKQNKNASTLSDMDFAYDFVQFYAVIDSICPANETVGIGYIQRIYYNSTSVNERFRQYVKVRWICCRECPLTIDEIELKMLTQMIPFNYKPKKSDYIGPSDKIGLRKRSVSPCVNIYGEIMEIAVPHYSTPVCPMYAVFDPISPGYEFDHEASTTKNLLVKMSDICLMVDNNTDSSECYWRFESLEKPIEMLCCCRSELEEELRKCSRQLRNRVDVSRCFVQHVQPFKRWGAEIDLAGDFKSQGMDIQSPNASQFWKWMNTATASLPETQGICVFRWEIE
ncbi:hypothetical protein L596_012494 [Steinernema carpocapsae]|uniref:AMOP domain-containing protein n=1 Tax=Steinernema carpocapsae TaxID=34508 RepID=A0A4U5NY43_STECR|nr:hypothetical protein L596_012494 [Steinernema carpocapsae]